MTMYRARGVDELQNIEFRKTKEEVFAMAAARLAGEAAAGRPQAIIIELVRESTLADFFKFDDLVSAMRERMQEVIGNDDALNDENVARLRALADPDIACMLEQAADSIELRIDGYVVLDRERIEQWWVQDRGDADE